MPEPTSAAMLQVQPPEPIAYQLAEPRDIRVLPESLFCFASVVSQPLRVALSLEDDVGFGGPVSGAFQSSLEEKSLPTARGAETQYPGDGVGQETAPDRLRDYRERCAWTPENIYIDTDIGMNAAGGPYRIVLTIRQADKEWRRVVEQLEGRRPEINDYPPYRVGPAALAEVSIQVDMRELSDELSETLADKRQVGCIEAPPKFID